MAMIMFEYLNLWIVPKQGTIIGWGCWWSPLARPLQLGLCMMLQDLFVVLGRAISQRVP